MRLYFFCIFRSFPHCIFLVYSIATMITKKQFLDGFVHEMNIIRHLSTKIEPSMLDYKPTEKQRTTLELLNYLGHIFNLGTSIVIAGTSENYKEIAGEAPVVTLENFDQIMKDQATVVAAKIEALSNEQLDAVVTIFGRTSSVSEHLFGISKWAVAYKMQLFLYIKACGKHDIGTSNLWGGVDAAPQA